MIAEKTRSVGDRVGGEILRGNEYVANLIIEKERTALVVIDLQKGIASRQTQPYSAGSVIENASKLANAFRLMRMPIFLVRVSHSPGSMLKTISDSGFSQSGEMPADWAEIVPELGPKGGDIVITKRQWGAFYGTDLDLHLRRMGIKDIVLCGIATSYGVESTARFAYEYNYQQIFAEDAMSDLSAETHRVAIEAVFKRMGRVRKTFEILKALEQSR